MKSYKDCPFHPKGVSGVANLEACGLQYTQCYSVPYRTCSKDDCPLVQQGNKLIVLEMAISGLTTELTRQDERLDSYIDDFDMQIKQQGKEILTLTARLDHHLILIEDADKLTGVLMGKIKVFSSEVDKNTKAIKTMREGTAQLIGELRDKIEMLEKC